MIDLNSKMLLLAVVADELRRWNGEDIEDIRETLLDHEAIIGTGNEPIRGDPVWHAILDLATREDIPNCKSGDAWCCCFGLVADRNDKYMMRDPDTMETRYQIRTSKRPLKYAGDHWVPAWRS